MSADALLLLFNHPQIATYRPDCHPPTPPPIMSAPSYSSGLNTFSTQIGDGIVRGFGWGLGMRLANELVNAGKCSSPPIPDTFLPPCSLLQLCGPS